MKNVKICLFAVLFLMLTFFGCERNGLKKAIVYYNGDIITMSDPLYAKFLRIEDGIITYVGDEIVTDDNTKMIDLKGSTLMPAFIDAHSHITQFAQSLTLADLSGAASIEDIKSIIEDYVKKNKIDSNIPIAGFGYDNNFLKEKRHPTRDDLDKISKDSPIVIAHISGHVGVMNSKALELLGIDKSAPDIEGGMIEKYDDTEIPNGYMEEAAFMNYSRQINFPLTMENIMNVINQAEDIYLSYGIATAQEALVGEREFYLLNTMALSNRLKIDIIGFIDLKNAPFIAETNKDLIDKYKNHFKIGGYKIFLDGSPQAKTAWLTKPYLNSGNYRGYPVYKNEEVVSSIKKALNDKMQLQAHCNGDAAADQYIGSFRKVLNENNITNEYRSVLIHSQVMRPEQYKEMGDINIIPSIFVSHIYYWGDVHIVNLGWERASVISASRSAMNAKLPYTFHEDTPVLKPDMLLAVWCAVNRITKDGVLLGEYERIPALDAFKGITVHAAYQNNEEHIKGSIEKGKKADFVILKENPLKIDPMKIKDIEILETIKDGEVLYVKN